MTMGIITMENFPRTFGNLLSKEYTRRGVLRRKGSIRDTMVHLIGPARNTSRGRWSIHGRSGSYVLVIVDDLEFFIGNIGMIGQRVWLEGLIVGLRCSWV